MYAESHGMIYARTRIVFLDTRLFRGGWTGLANPPFGTGLS